MEVLLSLSGVNIEAMEQRRIRSCFWVCSVWFLLRSGAASCLCRECGLTCPLAQTRVTVGLRVVVSDERNSDHVLMGGSSFTEL